MPKFLLYWGAICVMIFGISALLAMRISKKSSSARILETYLVAIGTFSGMTGILWMLFTCLSGGAEKMSGNIVMIIAVSLNALAGMVYAMNEKQLPTESLPGQMQKVGILLGSVNVGMYSGAMALGMFADKLNDDTKAIGFIVCLLVGGCAGLGAAALMIYKEEWLQIAIKALSELQKSKRAQTQTSTPPIPGSPFFKGWLIGTFLAIITSLSTTAAIAYGLENGFSLGSVFFGVAAAAASCLFMVPIAGMFGGMLIGTPLGFGIYSLMLLLNQRMQASETQAERRQHALRQEDDGYVQAVVIPNALRIVSFIVSVLFMIFFMVGLWKIPQFFADRRLNQASSGIQWQFTHGTDARASDVAKTEDGGYVATGFADSKKDRGNGDAWIIKLDANGRQIWEHVFDRKPYDLPQAVRPAADGGYFAAGRSSFANGVKNENWIRKLDAQGQFLWERLFTDPIILLQPTPEGCLVLSGTRPQNAPADILLFRLKQNGGILEKRALTRLTNGANYRIFPDRQDGYVAVGHLNYTEGWAAKITAQGQIAWEHTYGGNDTDILDTMEALPDKGYIVAGRTESSGNGDFDVWVVKLDQQGRAEWGRTFGTRGWDQAEAVAASPDGGYFIAASNGGGRDSDMWLFKLDIQGRLVWERTFGSMAKYTPYAVQLAHDGGYVVAGEKGGQAWIFKIDPEGKSNENRPAMK